MVQKVVMMAAKGREHVVKLAVRLQMKPVVVMVQKIVMTVVAALENVVKLVLILL